MSLYDKKLHLRCLIGFWIHLNMNINHCVKSVQIRSFFWSVFSCIRPEYGDYLDTFHAVNINMIQFPISVAWNSGLNLYITDNSDRRMASYSISWNVVTLVRRTIDHFDQETNFIWIIMNLYVILCWPHIFLWKLFRNFNNKLICFLYITYNLHWLKPNNRIMEAR